MKLKRSNFVVRSRDNIEIELRTHRGKKGELNE